MKKITELLTHKYHSVISVFVLNQGRDKYMTDNNNHTLFYISNDSFYSFKDKNQNHWLTVLEDFFIDEQCYHPVVGSEYIQSDGVKFSFTTKEAIISMAADYFEKFIDKDCGIEKKLSCLLFFFEGKQYVGEFSRFKSKIHDKIDAFISNN